jgi:hypothetical protein
VEGDDMGGTGVYIMELRNAYQIFVETLQWKRPLEILLVDRRV